IAVLCVWLGIQVNAARRQKEAVATIQKAGGKVLYDYQVVPKIDLNATPPSPEWLRQCIGDDYFRTAVVAAFNRVTICKGDLDQLDKLPCLTELLVYECEIRDADLIALAELRQLEVLLLWRSR